MQGRNSTIFNLTRRQCVSELQKCIKVAEVFDLTGEITPFTATLKLDLHTATVQAVVQRGLLS